MEEIKFIEVERSAFLRGLRGITGAVRSLYVIGTVPPERSHVVAIVGTRKPTSYGREVSYELAYKLARKGIIIVSGLAYGIDAIVHRAALDAGGTTIAIQANGLDQIYPAGHQRLAQEIVARGGAVLSEYPPGTPAYKPHFLARNRLVSGLADAVVIVEGAERSGTLSTVNHAIDQNKEVFAVPGPITSPLSYRPNQLIAEGAHPVLSADSILEVIAPALINAPDQPQTGENPLQTKILALLHKESLTTAGLASALMADPSVLLLELTLLEIAGTIRSDAEGRWRLSR